MGYVNKFKGENSIFAKRLKRIMEERNITQQDLAKIVGITRQAISLYLSGQSLPDIEKLYNIAEYLGISSDYLLGRADIKSPEIDDIAINRRLGLSDGAIGLLRELKETYGQNKLTDTINFLIEQEAPFSLNENCDKELEVWGNTHTPVLSRIADFLTISIADGHVHEIVGNTIQKRRRNSDGQVEKHSFAKKPIRPFSVKLIAHFFMLDEIENVLREAKKLYIANNPPQESD